MKTKILLSSLLIISITFIGLARPSQSEAFTDTILPQDEAVLADSQDVSQETTVQEKQEKKTITWVSEDGKKITFIISTDEEGEVKISKIDGDMKIHIHKDSEDGKKFTLLVGNKNLVLHKDEKGNWSLQADEGEKLSYHLSHTVKLGKKLNLAYSIKKDEKDKKVLYVKAPKIHIEKLIKPHGAVNIHVAPKIAIPYKKLDIHIEGEEEGKKWISVSPRMKGYRTPYVTTYSIKDAGLDQKKLKEKLAEITERLKEIRERTDLEQSKESREEALKEVEEMLKKLSEELKEKKAELKDITLSLHTDVKDVHLDKTVDVAVGVKKIDDVKWVEAKDINVDIKEGKNVAFVTTDDEGEFQIGIKADFDSENKSKYEAIVKKLKDDLPEGYTVESIIDEESEIFTINIKGVKKDKKAEKEIKEILEALKEQLSKIK